MYSVKSGVVIMPKRLMNGMGGSGNVNVSLAYLNAPLVDASPSNLSGHLAIVPIVPTDPDLEKSKQHTTSKEPINSEESFQAIEDPALHIVENELNVNEESVAAAEEADVQQDAAAYQEADVENFANEEQVEGEEQNVITSEFIENSSTPEALLSQGNSAEKGAYTQMETLKSFENANQTMNSVRQAAVTSQQASLARSLGLATPHLNSATTQQMRGNFQQTLEARGSIGSSIDAIDDDGMKTPLNETITEYPISTEKFPRGQVAKIRDMTRSSGSLHQVPTILKQVGPTFELSHSFAHSSTSKAVTGAVQNLPDDGDTVQFTNLEELSDIAHVAAVEHVMTSTTGTFTPDQSSSRSRNNSQGAQELI